MTCNRDQEEIERWTTLQGGLHVRSCLSNLKPQKVFDYQTLQTELLRECLKNSSQPATFMSDKRVRKFNRWSSI